MASAMVSLITEQRYSLGTYEFHDSQVGRVSVVGQVVGVAISRSFQSFTKVIAVVLGVPQFSFMPVFDSYGR